MREGKQALCFSGENRCPGFREDPLNLFHALFGPVEEIDFDKSSTGILEECDLRCGKSRGVPVDGDNRVFR